MREVRRASDHLGLEPLALQPRAERRQGRRTAITEPGLSEVDGVETRGSAEFDPRLDRHASLDDVHEPARRHS
jgi:hypothetical protein